MVGVGKLKANGLKIGDKTMSQAEEEKVNAALLDALGSEVFGDCSSMLERVSLLISQRDNSYNELAVLKKKESNDVGKSS